MSPVRKEQLTWMPISKLVALKRNPQYCTPAQMESLKTSIEQDGFVVPILIRKLPREKDRYEIVSGNHRVMAAREIGLTEVPCVLIRLTDKQTKRLAVNLNTIHGEPNPELLAPFLAEMEDDVLASIHLEQNELDKLLEFDDALERHLRALQPPKSHDANPVVAGMILGDYRAVGRFLSRAGYPAWFGPTAFRRYITNGGGFWFRYQGDTAGVGILNPRLSSMTALAVAEEHRGHGLGSAIVEFLQPNFVRAIEDKIPYFEKLGFVAVGEMKRGIRLNVQGAQIPLIGFDELTHFSHSQFFYMLSRNRSMCGVRPYMRATCNPDADSWVADFIEWWLDAESGYPIPARSGVVRWFVRDGGLIVWDDSRERLIENVPEAVPKSFTFIPANLDDNPALMRADPGYRANLLALPPTDQKRLLYGNWKIRGMEGAEWEDHPEYFGAQIWCAEEAWPDAFQLAALALDGSKGGRSKSSDDSAIVFAGYLDGIIYVDASLERRAAEKIVRDLLAMYSQYLPHVVGIESNGFQDLFAVLLDAECRRQQRPDLPIQLIHNSVNKVTRIRALEPYLSRNKFRIRSNAGGKRLVSQLRGFGVADHDDGPDALEMAIRLLNSLAGVTAEWGMPISPLEYADWGEPAFRRGPVGSTRVDDRLDGRCVPVYETEHDVARIRAMGRALAPSTSVAVGAIEALYNYVFGEGFAFTVAASRGSDREPQTGLLERMQEFVDTFLESNDVVGAADRDDHSRSREDGERFIALRADRRSIRAEVVQPEQVTEPRDTRPLDVWQGDEFGISEETSWSFGIHTPRRDAARPYGYHVVYDTAGTDWEYIPAERMLHLKRNVPRTAKRGISDFYPIARDLLGDEKLTRNLGVAAASIAAIVGVRKFTSGTLKTDINGLLHDQGGATVTRFNRAGESRTVTQEPFDGGSILNSGGYDWEHGPLGASNNPNLLLVAAHLRRSIGVRWTMPEYLVSGDASNANYASTSVAAESWVRSRRADQRFFGRHYVALLWKAARLAYDLGWFAPFDLGWNQLRRQLEIQVAYPDVATKDFLQVARANAQMIADGYKSRHTAATEQGLDYAAERDRLQSDASASRAAQEPRSNSIDNRREAVASRREIQLVSQHDLPSTDVHSPQQNRGLQPESLTLEGLESIAWANNPTLVQAQAHIGAAEGKAWQAGLYPNPKLAYVGEQIGVEGTAGEWQGGELQQEIVTAGKLRLSREKHAARASVAEAGNIAQQYRVLNDVRTHFYSTWGAQQIVAVRAELLKTAEDRLVTVKEQFNVGQANVAEVAMAEADLAEAKLELNMAENAARAEWEMLAAVIGCPLERSPLIADLKGDTTPIDWDAAYSDILAHSPQLVMAHRKVRADEITVERERVEPVPNVVIVGGVGRNFDARDTTYNAGAMISVPIFDRNQGTIRQAENDLAELRAFALGRSTPEELVRVQSHLRECPSCCEQLEGFGDDTFVALVRDTETVPDPKTQFHGADDRAPETNSQDAATIPPSVAADDLTEPVEDGPYQSPATRFEGTAPTEALLEHPRFDVLEQIGQGGMGAVYKAEHRHMKRTVALKVINAALIAGQATKDRFRREVEAAARLHHPNIVTAYDAELDGDCHFLVMEYVPGTDLHEVLKQRGPLPATEACDYVRQAALGLQHAMNNNMVHRDIKPHNLMLTPEGQVKILDFGLASLAAVDAGVSETVADDNGLTESGGDHQQSSLTQAGSIMGTPEFMAPEQAKDAHAADIRADIYSLGCTLYALLTGHAPFTGGTVIDKIIAHAEHTPEPVDSQRDDIPKGLADVLDKMLAKNPADRYQNPADLAAALQPFARPQAARPHSRKRWLVGATVFAALLLLGGVIWVKTDKGNLKIESAVDDVQIVVSQGGQQVDIIDLKTGTTVKRLPSGDYRLAVKGRRNDVRLNKGQVTIARGGKDVVTLSLVPAPATVVVDRREVSRVVAAGRGKLTPQKRQELLAENHPVLGQLADPHTKPIIELFAGLPDEAHRHLLKDGFLKWKYASLDAERRKVFYNNIKSNIDVAKQRNVPIPATISLEALAKADVGFAVVKIPSLKTAVVSWYILFPEHPQPMWVTVVGLQAADKQPYFSAHHEQLQKLRLKRYSRPLASATLLPRTAADLLKFWVGDWRNETRIVVPKLPPAQANGRGILRMSLVADGKFLRGVTTSDNGGFQTLLVQGWDDKKQRLLGWFFMSDGRASGPGVGTWDGAKRTIVLPERLPGGIQAVHQFEVVDADTVKARLFHQNEQNEIVFEMQSTFTRLRTPVAPKPVRIDPQRPVEMKVLDRLVGDWHNEVTTTQDGKTTVDTARSTMRHILAGRMVEGFDAVETANRNDYWLTWFDPKRKQFRVWFFGSQGPAETVEFSAVWDAPKSTMSLTSTDTLIEGQWIFRNKDLREFPITFKDKAGKVQMQMNGISRRLPDLDALQKQAEAWLKLMDDGRYGEAWEQSAAPNRKGISKADMVKLYTNMAARYGKVVSRKFVSRDYLTELPGFSKGRYVLIKYFTDFEKQKDMVQNVLLIPKNGAWKVQAHVIVPKHPLAAPKKKQAQPTDYDRLTGTWAPVEATFSGKKLTEEQLRQTRFKFDGDNVELSFPNSPTLKTRYALQQLARPKWIEFINPDPKKTGEPNIAGIYEFDGEKLKIAFGDADHARPRDFKPRKRQDHFTGTFVRTDRPDTAELKVLDRFTGSWEWTWTENPTQQFTRKVTSRHRARCAWILGNRVQQSCVSSLENDEEWLMLRAWDKNRGVISGPEQGRSLEMVDGATIVVGRGQDAGFRLDDPRVSRAHCRLRVENGTVTVVDADSTGGTRVNGSKVDEHQLKPGDVIQIGDSELRFHHSTTHDASTLAGRELAMKKPLPCAAPLEQLVGRTFAHFELESVIAPGQTGMVFAARDLKKDRPAAIKVLSPVFAAGPEERERFIRGIKTMAPIKHENIVALYAAAVEEPYCWVAMEYVAGENLTQVIDRIGVSGMLDWQHAFRIGVHIARALDEAAKFKVIHRNVTPQNILLRSSDRVAKLGDLTLAKALEGTMVGQLTRPGELVGDLAYMSPERTRGMETVDGRSDIYGLGATLYALLTGRPPIEGNSLPELISRIRSEEPVKPKSFQLSIPDMFQDVVLRMLMKRPEDRFPTAADLLADLQRVGKFQGVTV
eukprot:g33079.t1